MAFVKLLSENKLKHVISQNVDGLHRKSGIPSEKISELHGNIYIEKCTSCNKEYLRDKNVSISTNAEEHGTGNYCDNRECEGKLIDNIINFGENLDSAVIRKAFEEGAKADLCLAMGSSLRVNPAAQIPKNVGKNGQKLVIVNLQKTPIDKYAKLIIHALCDTVIEKLMQRLKLEIPEFRLKRYLKIVKENRFLIIQGVEEDDSPFSFIRRISIKTENNYFKLTKEPFIIEDSVLNNQAYLKLRFQANYGEPALKIKPNNKKLQKYSLDYNPFEGTWLVNELK